MLFYYWGIGIYK